MKSHYHVNPFRLMSGPLSTCAVVPCSRSYSTSVRVIGTTPKFPLGNRRAGVQFTSISHTYLGYFFFGLLETLWKFVCLVLVVEGWLIVYIYIYELVCVFSR